MGAWGAEIFENDAALDWTYDLEKSQGASLIAKALKGVAKRGDKYLDSDECYCALVAAEVVAALENGASPNLPDTIKQWVDLHQAAREGSLVESALKAIQRIRTNSELKDLWDESKQKAEWHNALDNLEARLNQSIS